MKMNKIRVCHRASRRSQPQGEHLVSSHETIGTGRRPQNLTRYIGWLSLLLMGTLILAINQSVKADIERHDGLIETSLIKIIVNPDKYDGKRVAVVGWLRNEFEDETLYISRDDADYRITENGIWINIPSSQTKSGSIENIKKGCVYVEGTFRKALSGKPGLGRGHMGMWQGEITDIIKLEKDGKK